MKWRAVVGFEGRYEVSDEGDVRGLDRTRKDRWGYDIPIKGRVMKQQQNKFGYMMVPLGTGTKQKKLCAVHRLVLIAFTEHRPDMQVNHKDGDKTNNHISNLEWVTAKQNCEHRQASGLGIKGERCHSAKLTADQIPAIKELREKGLSQQKIADEYGVSQNAISRLLRQKTWAHV